MTLPNFVIIGAAKAGTTALYWYLAEHPEIFMSPMKETNFLAYGRDGKGNLMYGDPELHRFRVTTLDAYEALFEEAGNVKAVGEASPIYLECPQTPERIKTLLPGAQIVCGLRDPVDRAYSDYQMYLRNRGKRLDPERDLVPDASWAQPGSHWMKIGRYHEMLSRYFDVIPREQVYLYLFRDLKTDSQDVIQNVYRFLGVDETYVPDLDTPHNVGGMPAVAGVERVLTSKRLRALAEPMIPRFVADFARRVRTANLEKAPPLPPAMRRRMIEYFEDDIVQAQSLLGLDLSNWLE